MSELTSFGGVVNRPLSNAEWASKRITLRNDGNGSTSVLYRVSGGWMYESDSGNFKESGAADCEGAAR